MSDFYWVKINCLISILYLLNYIKSYSFTIEKNVTSQELSSIINFDNGEYMIFYEKFTPEKNSGIFSQKFSFENVKISELKLTEEKFSLLSEKNPKTLYLSNNTFILLYQTQVAFKIVENSYDLNAQFFDKDYNKIGNAIKLTNETTTRITGTSIIKISEYLLAIGFCEYQRKTSTFSVNYIIMTLNGIIIKKETLYSLFTLPIDINLNYLTNGSFMLTFLDSQQNLNFTGGSLNRFQNYTANTGTYPLKILNIFTMNHNGKNYDDFIKVNKLWNDIFNLNTITNTGNFKILIESNYTYWQYQKYTTINNYKLLIFPNSNILKYNYQNIKNYQNLTISNQINTTNSNLIQINNTNTSSVTGINNTEYEKERNLIGIISSYDNNSYSQNSFTLLYSGNSNNNYIQLDILDYDYNLMFTKYFKSDNACCFEASVLEDGSFILTWQQYIPVKLGREFYSQVIYMEINSDLTMKTTPKILLPQINFDKKFRPQTYKFYNSLNSQFDKKLIIYFNTYIQESFLYQLYFSTFDCKGNFCIDEILPLKICDKSCKSCIGHPLVCTQCANSYYPMIGGIDSDFNYLNTNFLYGNSNLNNSELNSNSLFTQNCFNNHYPPANSYFDTKEISYSKCDVSCDGCENSGKECTKCNINHRFYPLISSSPKITCISEINNYDPILKQGYYFDKVNNVMKECSDECKTCMQNQKNCMECNNDDGYFSVSETYLLCQKNPLGFYLDKQNKIYRKCFENCLKCQDSITCEICDEFSSLLSDKKKCYYCGEGKFYDEIRRVCKDCSEIGFCISCSSKGCYECRDNFEFKPFKSSSVVNLSNLKNQATYTKYEDILGSCEKCVFGYVLISNKCESVLIIVIPISILIFLIFIVIIIVIRLKRVQRNNISQNYPPNLHNPDLPPFSGNNNRLQYPFRNRNIRNKEKSTLNEIKPVNDEHDAKCIFGDENPPFWLFDCGGYMCNQCSFKVVADVKTKQKCNKCNKDLKNFRYINRYINTQSKEENNTIIDLDDVNLSSGDVEEDNQNKEIELCNRECGESGKKKENIQENSSKRELKKIPEKNEFQTCQICFVLKSSKKIVCQSATPHMICSYCYNRMLKIDKIKLCPFCRTKIVSV